MQNPQRTETYAEVQSIRRGCFCHCRRTARAPAFARRFSPPQPPPRCHSPGKPPPLWGCCCSRCLTLPALPCPRPRMENGSPSRAPPPPPPAVERPEATSPSLLSSGGASWPSRFLLCLYTVGFLVSSVGCRREGGSVAGEERQVARWLDKDVSPKPAAAAQFLKEQKTRAPALEAALSSPRACLSLAKENYSVHAQGHSSVSQLPG